MLLTARRLLLIVLPLLASSCAAPPAAGVLPPPAPGAAQIVIYRELSYYTPSSVLTVALNSQGVGAVPLGSVIYRDVAPGAYTVSFTPTRPAPNQFATLTLSPGQVAYVKLAALPARPCTGATSRGSCSDIAGFTSQVMEPETARREIASLRLAQR